MFECCANCYCANLDLRYFLFPFFTYFVIYQLFFDIGQPSHFNYSTAFKSKSYQKLRYKVEYKCCIISTRPLTVSLAKQMED